MYKFAFIVLHYMNVSDTIECVDSIIRTISGKNYDIIVVDNGSNNGSYEVLKERYLRHSFVHILRSQENIGFARGNNIGFKYAKHRLGSDFIILLNNDTILLQPNFLEKIEEIYRKTEFAVLGPDITTPKGEHQNPQRVKPLTISEAKRLRMKFFILLTLNFVGLDAFFQRIYRDIKRRLGISPAKIQNDLYLKELENVQLHGACLIFSPEYVKRFEGLYDKTFLYVEEDILFHLCLHEGLKTLYSPEIRIFHKEDGSTDFIYRTSSRKRRFIYLNTIKSLKVFLNFVRNYENEVKRIKG